MYANNKVRLEICGTEYVINTSEEPSYVKGLAFEIEDTINAVMNKNSAVTLNDAYLLCTLEYADKYKKSEENADHIRGQVAEYLEDVARARIELDEARREIDRLRQQVASLNSRLEAKQGEAGGRS